MQRDALALALDELQQPAMSRNFAQQVVDQLPPSYTIRVLRNGNGHQPLAERREGELHQVGHVQELARPTLKNSGERETDDLGTLLNSSAGS
jgi:hypothetical protein